MAKHSDPDKLLKLSTDFALHEEWVQKGRPATPPQATIPGYSALATQNGDAYELYRRSLHQYLSEAKGEKTFFREFRDLIVECEANYSEGMTQFWRAHHTPSDKFKGQWNNFFERFKNTNLTHENCFKYQQIFRCQA